MEVLHLRPGHTAIFGYGSLLSRSSLDLTLGRRYNSAFLVCALRGWVRTWDVAMPNDVFFADDNAGCFYPKHILYLNLRRNPGVSVNGVLFVTNAADLRALDQREWIYDRVDVAGELEGATVQGGQVFAYVGKPEYIRTNIPSPRDAAVRASYVATLDSGLAAMDGAFRRDYQRSTEPTPWRLVIADRRQPRNDAAESS